MLTRMPSLSLRLAVPFLLLPACAAAQDGWRVDLEGGVAYQSRNTVARPGTDSRTSLRDLVGSGPAGYGRLTAISHPDEKYGLRFVIQPLTLTGIGVAPHDFRFNGVTFLGGQITKGSYTFNSYRIGYWRRWRETANWTVRGGFEVGFRDASISIQQPGTPHREANYSNFGPVPLFHIDADWRIDPSLTLSAEFDGLPAPGGGLYEPSLILRRKLDRRTEVYGSVRFLDGGYGADEGYYFFTGEFLGAGISIRF